MTGHWLRRASVVAGLTFLYVPMLVLIVFSFNESRLVTVWAGFSTKWYGELLHDRQILSGVWLSLKVAVLAATSATVLGTLAGLTLARFGMFRGRSVFGVMVSAPLVMPEVITGLSLLLLFVAMGQLFGWPAQRGTLTIWIAHVTFCTAYASVVIAARLGELDTAVEDAAMDLGATPARVFFSITLPVIAPALISAWLLAFTLSLDDLVITSFVTGPGASTLPIVVFSSARLGVSPKINALAAVLILAVFTGTLAAWWWSGRRARRARRQAQGGID